MRNLIIVSSNYGTTKKAADILSGFIGGADIFDTAYKDAEFNFDGYDNYIFGTNIRMFMLNGRFKKYARRLRRYYKGKNSYGYLIGCAETNDRALKRMSKIISGNKGTVYAWGEYVTDCDDKRAAEMYKNMKSDCEEKGNELPHIREEELKRLADIINEG